MSASQEVQQLSALDRPVDLSLIRRLERAGILDDKGRLDAMSLVNGPVVWWPWVSRALIFLGLALVLAGVICFFAWNWEDLPGLAKLGLIATAILGCSSLALKTGLDSLTGQSAQTAAAVLVGVFLAVFGQVYQTGADAWENFTLWAVLISPWVVQSRFAPLWLTWLTVTNVAVSTAWFQLLAPGIGESSYFYYFCSLLGLVNGTALVAREWGAARGWQWVSEWLRPLLVTATLVFLTIPAIAVIVLLGEREFELSAAVGAFLLAVTLLSLYRQFRVMTPDLLSLSLMAISAVIVLATAIIRVVYEIVSDVALWFVSGFVVIALVAALSTWLLYVRNELLDGVGEPAGSTDGVEDGAAGAGSTHVSQPEQPEPPGGISVGRLLEVLVDRGQFGPGDAQRVRELLDSQEDEESVPWFIHFLIGLGAWVSCFLFLGGLGSAHVFEDDLVVLAIGIVLLVVGTIASRRDGGVFVKQLALSGGLTGLVMISIYCEHVMIPALVVAVCYPFFRDNVFRLLACSGILVWAGVWLVYVVESEVGFHLLLLVETLAIGMIFNRWNRPILRPLGHALALCLPGSLLMTISGADGATAWPAAMVQVLAQLWLLAIVRSTSDRSTTAPFGIAAAGTALLGFLSAPGLLVAIGLTIYGHIIRDWILRGIGIAFLPVYLVVFYYDLETTFLVKSGILVGTGIVLWMIREFVAREIEVVEAVA